MINHMPPGRTITRGPPFHWFGYYDKLQFDPTGRLALSGQVDFEHRSPAAADVMRVGVVDTQDGDRWTELGVSNAWGWIEVLEVLFRTADGEPRPSVKVGPDSEWSHVEIEFIGSGEDAAFACTRICAEGAGQVWFTDMTFEPITG